MGQRLVVTVWDREEDDTPIAKIYYHWSAYTSSALSEINKIIEALQGHEDNTRKENIMRLIRMCEKNGGGIDGGLNSEEGKYIRSLYPNYEFSEDISRSYGLIAITENGMNDMQKWSEGDVDIYIKDKHVNNYVVGFVADSYEEFKALLEEDGCDDVKEEDIVELNYDICSFDFDDIKAVDNEYTLAGCPDFFKHAGMIYEAV